MPYIDSYLRLEPKSPAGDLDEGFAARIADPAWFLARQWQLGEYQGEDAGSPVVVKYKVALQPLRDPQGRDAETTPTEVLVEAAPYQWWTPGRRVRIGKRLLDRALNEEPELAERLGHESLRVRELPPPYVFLNGQVLDGLQVYLTRAALGVPDAWFTDLPAEALEALSDAWDPRCFAYAAHLDAGPLRLDISHEGGSIDWFSCDASLGSGGAARPIEEGGGVALPVRMNYLGAPAPRWWELENRKFDVGGFPPDRSHFATLLLIDVVSSHSDDWFLFPIDTPDARLGQLLTVTSISVLDSFGESFEIEPPIDDWTLFQVDGLADSLGAIGRWSLPLLPRAVTPLVGPPIDEVDLNIDENANLLWAAERRIQGVSTPDDIPSDPRNLSPNYDADTAKGVPQRYDPTTPLRPNWHPYLLQAPRMFDRYTETLAGVRDNYRDL